MDAGSEKPGNNLNGEKASLADGFARFLVVRRGGALMLALLVAAVAAAGLMRIGYSNDYRVFFDDDNPELQALSALEDTYARTDAVMVVVHAPDGAMFRPERLEVLRDLTERLWMMPHVTRVDSLTNYQHSWAADDDLHVADLVPAQGVISSADAARAQDVALAEPLVAGRLVSRDGRTAGVVATLHMPMDDPAAMQIVADHTRTLVAEVERETPSLEFALSGSVMLNAALFETARRDTAVLFPLMALILFGGLFFFFRSARYGGAVFAVVGLSVMTTVGLMGWFGVAVMSATAVVPVIVLTIAVADAIHLLVGYRFARASGMDGEAAAAASLSRNLMPVLITTVTTAFGFLALNFADAPPYRDVGNMAAIGAGAALFFTFTLLPFMMARLPAPRAARSFAGSGVAGALAGLSVRRPAVVLFVFLVLTGVSVIAMNRLHVNDKFVEYFDTDVHFRADATLISAHLPGLYFLEFSIPSGSEGGINEPAYLEGLDAFARWLGDQPEVTHVTAFADVMKRLNRNMHGDDPAYYRLPASREMAAQYLLLYEMSLPFGRDLNDRIDVARSATRVTAVMDDIPSGDMQALKRRAEAWLGQNFPGTANPGQTGANSGAVDAETMGGQGTGTAIIFAFLTERTLTSMADGAALAVILIAVSLVVSLRSVRLGGLSLLVNLIPIILGFGLWAMVMGEIGLYAAAVGTTALGMIVDFAVHMIAKYARQRRETPGNDPAEDMIATARTVGPALFVSGAVLAAGFLTLMLSDFLINAYLGLMTALVIAIALVTDLTLLPALVGATERNREKTHATPR